MSAAPEPSVFISVAEDSADVHAASLVRAARQILGPLHFYGLTGPRLRELGVETVADLAAHAAMLGGIAAVVGKAWRALRAIEAAWRARRPDLVILIDSPELHLRIAPRAKALGIPVLYYVAPQTWASRDHRNALIARVVDRLACILPFEEEYFRAAGANATYVGHPLFEALAREQTNPGRVARLRAGPPLVAVLPGSRRHLIRQMLPLQLAALNRMRGTGVACRAAISAVDAERAGLIRQLVEAHGADAEVVVADNASLLSAAELVLVASGTATLHVAHFRKPMIVLYDVGPVLGPLYEAFGRRFVYTSDLSLVNILAGRRVVPEFMPRVTDPGAVARVAVRMLRDRSWRGQMIAQIDQVVTPLERGSASANVCGLMAELLAR